MKTIKVSEATNTQLDWLVAKCEDRTPSLHEYSKGQGDWFILMQTGEYRTVCAFSTSWSQMGPIIERERISVEDLPIGVNRALHPTYREGDLWEAKHLPHGEDEIAVCGPTYLIAAARCYVTAKLGETVEVPEELS